MSIQAHYISVRLSQPTIDKLNTISEESDIKRATLIRMMIEESINNKQPIKINEERRNKLLEYMVCAVDILVQKTAAADHDKIMPTVNQRMAEYHAS